VADYVEAVLLWSAGGPSPDVRRWLEDRGLVVTPMVTGLLVSGSRQHFQEAFGTEAASGQAPYPLPVPEALQGAVDSIVVPAPRHVHGSPDA